MMTYDSKGRQCILYQCPVKDCSSKSNQITRHLTGAKHKWTEVDASGYISYCTRTFKYQILFKRIHVMTPRMCLICKQFFARIDNHLAVDHNLDRGSNRYQEMKELYKNETQRFLEHGFNRS